ncbi:uncharacterized protein LOC144452876 [Glandiceps talaboti]
MELVRTMSEQVTEKFDNSLTADGNRKVFPAIAHMPNLQHLYSPSPTKSHDSGVSLNKSTPQNEFDRLPRLVELSSQASKSEYRRELTTVRTGRFAKQMSSPRRKVESVAGMNNFDESDTANQFNPDPMPYQARNFRSSTMIRSVPLSRRHQESFTRAAGPTLVKTKTVPFHTKPFLWDPIQRMQTSLFIEPSQRNKFRDEEGYLEEVRGLKRKREVLPHRVQYADLSIDGLKHNMHEKMDYSEELDKLKSVPFLPAECQELYHGRGIKLPPSHSSNRKPEPKYPLPQPPLPPAPVTKTKTFTEQVDEPVIDDRDRELKVQPPAKMKRQSTNLKRREKRRGSNPDKSDSRERKEPQTPEKREPKTQMEKMEPESEDHGTQETRVEITIDDQENDMETEEKAQSPPPDDRPESEMDIEVPADETDNLLKPNAPSISPIKSVSPNPLKSVDLSLHVSDSRRAELTEIFKKLDSNKDGHITFPELSTQLSKHMTKSQQKYLKEVYEITSASTFFGLEEFMTVMCLCDSMVQLSTTVKETYDRLDFASLEQNITQFVELYSAVDRHQSGSISVESLQGILSTALDKDISDRNFQAMLQDLNKNSSSNIDKVEFLAYIPYFQSYK